jgi:hypothetical protein
MAHEVGAFKSLTLMKEHFAGAGFQLSPERGSCVSEGYREINRGLVNERAVPGSLPDRTFQRGLGYV